MRQVLVDTDRGALRRLQESLSAEFHELPPGVVLGVVTRSRAEVGRSGPGEGLWEAVELVARRRLVDLVEVRGLSG